MPRSRHSDPPAASARRAHAAAPGLLAACLLCLGCASAQQPQSTWFDVGRVVAFGDVHGAADELTGLLRAVGVVDENLGWSAGTAHVVSLGDLLDRGADSRAVMDLLMRLQEEATAAGGALHVLLGNHEAMNLLGDLRYVTPEEFAAFAAEEPAGQRERSREEWLSEHGRETGDEFDERFPPGYFGHRAAFSADGQYGRWLLGLPVAIGIDDTLFMHGGPSAVLDGLSLDDINRRYRSALSGYLGALDALTATRLVRPEDEFADRAQLAAQRQADVAAGADFVRRFVDADQSPMLGIDGPNWYRGAALCHEVSERDVLEPLLDGLGASRLVIGHTVAHNQRAASRFDGAVIKLDTGMNPAAYGGHPAALLLERGEASIFYADGSASSGPVPSEPLYVTSPTLDDATVARLLAEGTVTVGVTQGARANLVTVELDGRRVSALFVRAGDEAVNRERAAYRLDRALGLGLVPATVRREIDGAEGYLQARPASSVTQLEVEAGSLRPDGWCALAPQIELMYAFDALIGNEGRTRDRILFDTEWMLLLTGHELAFGTSGDLPRHLQARPPQPGAEMRRRLAVLDAAGLEEVVGDLLGSRERGAILERRDALLAAGEGRR
jgi:hypothetical protein